MQIYIQRNGEDFGPYSLEEMNRYLAEGSMSPRDRAWHEGIEGWIPLAEVEGIVPPDGDGMEVASASRGKKKWKKLSVGAGVCLLVATVGTFAFLKLGGGHRGGDLRAGLLGDGSSSGNVSFDADESGFTGTIQPFLKTHCVRCHGPEKDKASFRVDRDLSTDFLDAATKEKWGEVVDVLNSHEMPPEEEPQPKTDEVAKVVDWITRQMVSAELVRRDGAIVLRRMNRTEYRNTIRDLTGVDYDVSAFPQDPAAGGFDNNSAALTISPLHLELFIEMAQGILDRALVEGPQPEKIKWRFQPEEGDSDSHRIQLGKQRPIVHGGKNRKEGDFTVMHHDSWNLVPDARDFRVFTEGEYVIRVRVGGRVPDRAEVVAGARKSLEARIVERAKKDPRDAERRRKSLSTDLKHFENDRIYDYGPPRLQLLVNLGGQPATVAEWDVDAPKSEPKVYEFRTRFTTEKAGIKVRYAYSIPSVLENFWCQTGDDFARPEAWLDWFELEGPVYESWPPPSHRTILPDSTLANSDERAYARDVLATFMRRAYRRAVTAGEIDTKMKLYDAVRNDKPTFVEAIKIPLIGVLASPDFLYLAEPGPGSGGNPRVLTSHEVATRLSYFLWSTMPDEKLFELADADKLLDGGVVLAQVDRMLEDGRSAALTENFAGQWLGLREVGANPPASDLYPKYDRHLETSAVAESENFFAEILRHDLSALNLIKSDFAVLNERLARFYNVPGVRGDAFRRVSLPAGSKRGGVMTQASILSITSNGTRTSPVKRGVWLLKNILGTDPGLPVANAGDLSPKVPGIDKATVRKRLEIHRELPQCARCHDKIDPLGFALENFNAAGEWREREGFGWKGRVQDNDPKINAASQLPDGTQIEGIEDLQDALVKKEDLFLKCIAGKMLSYAVGRELGVADAPFVSEAVGAMKNNGYTLRSLIHYIATSKPFLTK
ncbi:MAG: DUF1592 domain-containing protein [Verrucomicrobiae bacterium]|jgi:hypothetical protein|nr:DUF1592 domain-containing protein [Verrucomicrobiae bacterium]